MRFLCDHAFAAQIRDGFDLVFPHQVCDALYQGGLFQLKGDLRDYDPEAAVVHFLDMSTATKNDPSSSSHVGLADAFITNDDPPGWKVRSGDKFDQLIQGCNPTGLHCC